MGDIVLSEVAKDLIINIINIIVLFVIVRSLVYKPVKKFLGARTARIQEAEEKIKSGLESCEAAKTERDQIIAQGQQKASDIINEAERKARESAAQITAGAEKAASDLKGKARSDMAAEREAMMEKARDDIAALAIDISERILQREVKEEDSRKIADQFFEEMGERS